jgi:DeoR/GlpR family transcriptional regulator of sugar metabolism
VFAVERRNRMVALLNEKKSLIVQEIAAHFSVTEETIRRDLKILESQGLLIRTHGGAILADDSKTEASLEIRQIINIQGKDAIGSEGAKLVNDGDIIILDASTSSLFLARHLKGKKGLTVITNAMNVLLELAESPDITLISTGGILRPKSLSYVGRTAENALNNYFADTLFFSCKGFSPFRGLSDSNEQESDIRKTMLQCCNQAVFLCDRTKLDKMGYVTTARLEDIDIIITDSPLGDEWTEQIANSQVELRVVPAQS